MAQDDSKYTDPEMRQEIKEDIQEGDKGGAPGQWTARKAQLTAKEYENQGGEYTTEKKDESQQNLTNWGDKENKAEEESKKEESGDKQEEKEAAKDDSNEQAEKEKEAADEKEAEPAAEEQSEAPADEPAKEEAAPTDQQLEDEDLEEDQEEPEEEQSDYEDGSDGEPPKKSRKTNGEASAGTRKTPQRARKPPQDKPAAKTSEPNEHGQAGSSDRLPEVGQKVHWKSGASITEGEVVEVLKSETMLGKRKYKASESDPRLKVKSSSSGKEAVHKPEAVYW